MNKPEYSSQESAEERQALIDQVQLLLESETFRNQGTLCRLLKFLANRSLTGEAEQLNGYSVAVDALGKPETFDPRQDSSVRFQMGRLRKKIEEYYAGEGKDDPFLIGIPKGSFTVVCRERPAFEEPIAEPSGLALGKHAPWIVFTVVLACWGIISTVALWHEREKNAKFQSLWTSDLELLWRAYLTSSRPLVVTIEEPLFVQLKGFGVYRELSLNRWQDIVSAPRIESMQKALGASEIQPYYYYAPLGEVQGAFLLGKLLGTRIPASLAGSRQLSWQQIANNNVIYLGAAVFVSEQLKGLPIEMQLVGAPGGWKNLHPLPGELPFYRDQLPSGPAGDGEVYAVVSHTPGPLGTGHVTLFFSNAASGRLAAVNWFTSGDHAKALVDRMKNSSGRIPDYYQVLLRVQYRDEVPTEATYVLHRELRPDKTIPSSRKTF